MAQADTSSGKPMPTITRDAAWQEDVRFETIRMIADVEQRSVAANVIGWLVIAVAAMTMPQGDMFVIPLALRAGAMILNRWGWNCLRRDMRLHPGTIPGLHRLRICLLIAGATWAVTLLPLLVQGSIHPGRVAVGGTVLIGVGLIFTMLAPLKSVAFSLASGFFLVLAAGIAATSEAFGFAILVPLIGMGGALVAFSYAASRQKVLTAEMLVDNRRLEAALGSALESAEYLATRDPLTGMLNRRAFFEAERHPTLRNGAAQHLLTIDLDHFKLINDTHGHDVGDQVLVATAKQIRATLESIPGSGHCGCRFGGEEFVVFVNGTDTQMMRRTAEALRHRIRRIPSSIGMQGAISVSASIGVARLGPEESFDDALRRSDLAMYRAKDRGRDQVQMAA